MEVVERINKIPVRAGSQVGTWQRGHFDLRIPHKTPAFRMLPPPAGVHSDRSVTFRHTSSTGVRPERRSWCSTTRSSIEGHTTKEFPMITMNTTPARAAVLATIAAICFTVAACGSEQGTRTDREGHHTAQHASADDVAAHVEHRKAMPSPESGRPQHATADDVEAWIEQHKLLLGKH
jgi:hypothetical protein